MSMYIAARGTSSHNESFNVMSNPNERDQSLVYIGHTGKYSTDL